MDTHTPLPTIYPSSKGPMDIATMPYSYLCNAIAKREREGVKDDILYALKARKDVMDIELAAAEAAKADAVPNEPTPLEGVIGGNNPPPTTPFDEVKTELEDLKIEAKNWLDGAAIKNQSEADEIARLRDKIDAASAKAEKQRIIEKKPHDDAANAVQAKYNTLIGNTQAVRGVAVTMRATINTALTAWLNKVKADQDAIREKAETEAREAAHKAEQHIAFTHDTTDLDDRDAALREIDIARQKAIDLAAANRLKPQVHGEGRAIGLVTKWRAEVTDVKAALQYYRADRTEEYWDALTAVVAQFAKDDIACKKTGQEVPGIKFIKEEVAR